MWNSYAELAAQYYALARMAAREGYLPLSGNLMHQAIELQLKCGLLKARALPETSKLRPSTKLWLAARRILLNVRVTKSLPNNVDGYLRRKYGHSLRKIWRDFKRCHPAENLSEFDDLVKGLDRWKDIRYPRRGIAMLVQVSAGQSPTLRAGGPATSRFLYSLNIERLDTFTHRTWALMNIEDEFFRVSIRAHDLPVVASIYEDDTVYVNYL